MSNARTSTRPGPRQLRGTLPAGLAAAALLLAAHCGLAPGRLTPAKPAPEPISPRPAASVLAAPAPVRTGPDGPAPPPRAALPASSADLAPVPGLNLAFAPDPDLQRLIDPQPARRGPSWLGGDVATSVRVAADRWAWLFGDTLLGTLRTRCPHGRSYCGRTPLSPDPWDSLVRNSAGVMRRRLAGGFAPVVKYWRTERGAPAAIFGARAPEEFLWPLSAARIGGALLVAASRQTIESGLRPLGDVLIRVSNPASRPDGWTYTLYDVPNVRAGALEPDPLTWATAMVVRDGYLHLFGERGEGLGSRTVLARLPLAGLDEPGWAPAPEYLVEVGPARELAWSRDFAPDALHVLEGLPGTSEATIEHCPGLGWISFRIPPLDFDVRAYTAPDLEGPWTDRGVVYRVPPPWSVLPRTDCLAPEAGCGWEHYAAYAVKSHPELAPPGGFALSYNVNLLFGSLEAAEREVKTADDFYVPQMIAGVPFPPLAAPCR